jgi:1,4-alpha-glucan branching enzyme
MHDEPSLSSVQWKLQGDPGHRGVQSMVKALNHLYASHPDLHREREENRLRWIDIKDSANNVVSFHRGRLACVCNFSPNTHQEYDIHFPPNEDRHQSIKAMKELFNSDSAEFGGSGKINPKVTLIKRGAETVGFKVNMPPLAMMIFEEQ